MRGGAFILWPVCPELDYVAWAEGSARLRVGVVQPRKTVQSNLVSFVQRPRDSPHDAHDACTGTPGEDLRGGRAEGGSDDELGVGALHELDELQAGLFVEEDLESSGG